MTMNTPQAVVSKMERCIVTLVIGKEHDAPRYPFIIPMVRDALLSELYYQIRVRAAIKDLIDVADIVDIRLNAPDGPFLGNDDKICDTIRDDEMEKVFAVVNRTESGHRFSIQAASTQTTVSTHNAS